MTVYIHPLATTDDSVSIGEGTKIWQYSSVIRGTILGKDCSVASSTTLDGPVFGDRCKIMHNVAMGPGFIFGNDCFVGPGVVLCNDAWPRSNTDGFRTDIYGDGNWAVIVEDGASIGANATVLPGVRIGKNAMVAAGAVVSKNVPADHIYMKSDDIKPIGLGTRPTRIKFATYELYKTSKMR